MNVKNTRNKAVIISCLAIVICVILLVSDSATAKENYSENYTDSTEYSSVANNEASETTAVLIETTTIAVTDTEKDAVVKVENSKTKTTEESDANLTEREFMIHNIVVSAVNSNIGDTKLRYIRSVLEGLPEKFFSWNVSYINIVDNIPGYGKNCRGLSVYSEKTIYLNSNTPSNAMIRSSIYHEFAHFADVSFTGYTLTDRYARSPEWTDAYRKEGDNLYVFYPGMNDLSEDNQKAEAFAMVFDAYYTGCLTGEKIDIKNTCPEMYQLISEFVK